MQAWNRVNNTRTSSNAVNNGDKPVCQYFLRGTCKFGDACRYYHPPQGQPSTQSANRGQLPYMLNADSVRSDLTEGDSKPIWPLSAYGPGRNAPRQLMEGSIEQSPDELRVQYYLAKAAGNTQQYEAAERAAVQQAENQVRQILSDVDGAIKYVVDSKDQHPNREDMTISLGSQWPPKANANPFGSSTGSAFGQPSTLGGSATATSAFGRSSMPGATSAFGQPSTLGGKAAFGQPSAGVTPFGQSSTTVTASAFGQPSTIGSAFGRSSALGGNSSAFGQPSTLGGNNSAFGQPSTLGSGNGGSAFGQASTLGNNASPFATAGSTSTPSVFGQQSAPGGSASAFGKPSPFAAQPAAQSSTNTSTFGASLPQAQMNGTPFGQQQPATNVASPFGNTNATNNTSAFGQKTSTFGQSSSFGNGQAAATTNGTTFGQPTATGPQSSNPFANTANKPSPFGASTAKATPQPQATAQPSGPITSFNGRPVEYLRTLPNDPSDNTTAPFYMKANGRKERIWMPHGAPAADLDAEAPEAVYQSSVGTLLKQVFDFAQQSDVGFKDGFVPEIPPKREWISFEL